MRKNTLNGMLGFHSKSETNRKYTTRMFQPRNGSWITPVLSFGPCNHAVISTH